MASLKQASAISRVGGKSRASLMVRSVTAQMDAMVHFMIIFFQTKSLMSSTNSVPRPLSVNIFAIS